MIKSVLFLALLAVVQAPCLALARVGEEADRVLDDVDVVAATAVPLWELSRDGNRLLILSDYFPRRVSEDTYVDVAAVQLLAKDAEALVYGPGVLADDSGGLFGGLLLLRAYRNATRIPAGGTLADVLEPDVYAKWIEIKELYMPRDRSVERLRPAYAASELYKAAMDHYGVQSTASSMRALWDAFEDREEDRIDARYRLDVDINRRGVSAFEIEEHKAEVCLSDTLESVRPSLEMSQEGADAWDARDMEALRDYFSRAPVVDRCWERLINQRTAELMGQQDPYRLAPGHWVGIVEDAFKTRDILITHLPARTVITESGVIALLKERGWAFKRLN
jgi:hypothetical protein